MARKFMFAHVFFLILFHVCHITSSKSGVGYIGFTCPEMLIRLFIVRVSQDLGPHFCQQLPGHYFQQKFSIWLLCGTKPQQGLTCEQSEDDLQYSMLIKKSI